MKQLRLVVWFTLLLLVGCTLNRKLSNQNLVYIYEQDHQRLNAQISFHHLNAVKSDLHFGINSKKLLYAKKPGTDVFVARVKVNYKVFQSYDNNTILDSATHWITDTTHVIEENLIYAKIPIRMAYPGKYLVKVNITDYIKNVTERQLIEVQKQNFSTAQSFIKADKNSGLPIFSNAIQSEEIKVGYTYKELDKFYVHSYKRDFSIPPPPFSNQNLKSFDFTPDNTVETPIEDSIFSYISVPENQFYFITINKDSKDGLALYNFGNCYPKPKSEEDLILPLRYICSNKEYNFLMGATDKKYAVDEYWLQCAGGNKETARTLIKNYYHRVTEANTFFTSYVEGWKTDRGMISIVFGKPSVIYKDETTETWIYGEENSPITLQFQFVKVKNPFTNNDFYLLRSPLHKNPWYAMVERWRKGRITDNY